MAVILAQLAPRDPVTDARPVIRAASCQDRRVTGLNGQRWFPAMSALPAQNIRLFDGDFSSDVEPGTASLTLEIDKILDANARRYLWAGAEVIFYKGNPGDAWPWPQCFAGKVTGWEAKGNQVRLTASVDTEPFEADVLTSTYAGTGGAEGDANLKAKVKPWLFGRATNVEPVLINAVDNVYQFSAYGPIQAITTLFERGAAFPASIGDYASYAALVAASIPNGKFGTCLASGMIRLGAPAYGVITADLDGHVESGTFLRLTGAIISCIATRAGVSAGLLDTASLAALDTAAAALCPAGGYINLYLTEQTKVIDIARRLTRPCNAQAGVSWLGKLFAVRVAIGAVAITLDGQGKRLPRVAQSAEADVSPPYWRIVMGGQRAWRVHSYDEIATYAQLVDRGPYSAIEIYREGNFTQDQGMSWLYVNVVAGAGNAPPTLPTSSNAWWKAMDPKLAGIEDGAAVNSNIEGDAIVTLEADYLGVLLSGEITRDVPYKLYRNGVVVTSGLTWSRTIISGTSTTSVSGAGTGTLSVTAFTSETKLLLSASYGGAVVATFNVTVTVHLQDQPTGGGAGAPSASTSSISGTSSSSYGAANAGPLTIRCPASGTINYSAAPLNYKRTTSTAGSSGAHGKVQWRIVGGTFADVTTETASNSDATTLNEPPVLQSAGTLPISGTKTGLTSGSDYEFQLLLRSDGATQINFNGTFEVHQ